MTGSPSVGETVEDGVNGLLVEPRTVEPLADAMMRLAADPAAVARFAEAGRRIAEDKYDVHKVNAVLLQTMELT